MAAPYVTAPMSRMLDPRPVTATLQRCGCKPRMSRPFGIRLLVVALSLVLTVCSPVAAQASFDKSSPSGDRIPSPSRIDKSSATGAQLIQPAGPISPHPALLSKAHADCEKAHAPDIMLCAGTVDAEVWGFPLVIMSHTRDALACRLGVNHLYNATSLAGPTSTSVVAPNDDTLYSTAFLDLRAGPLLLEIPPVSGRYLDFQLMDMYTNTIADIGVLTNGGRAGTYAFIGPGWQGTIPKGIVRIHVPTTDAWLLGRTQVKGPADLPTTEALQRQYLLRSLTGSGSGAIGGPSSLACPAQPLPSPTSPQFLDELGKDMVADPPMAADAPVVRAMASAGIRPGRTFASSGSGNASQYLMALRIGATQLADAVGKSSIATSTGWTSGAVVGSYGTDYLTRASVAKQGLGAQVPTQAVYFHVNTKSGMKIGPLVGSDSDVIRFTANDLPPHGTDGFWSITMYNASRFLVANPINRYSIGSDTANLVRGHDGSLTIVMSGTRPAEQNANWLPAPVGAFSITLRVYDPTRQVLDGSWSPPRLEILR